MYYIYEWYDEKTNEIIYVGKGSKKRFLCKKHNSLFNEYIKSNKCNSRIIEYYDNEQDAFKREFERINELKEINQCKFNLVKGGNGGGSSIKTKMNRWSYEERKKYSENNVMKRENQRKRMSEFNPMKNKDIALIVGKKLSKPFYIGDCKYNNLYEASVKYKTSISTISYWIKVGHNKNELCYYENEKPKDYDFSKNPHCTRNIKIKYNNVIYNSIKELAKSLNVSYTSFDKKIKNGKFKVEYIQQDNQQPSTNLNDL